jgi:aminopeptidase N
MKWFFRQWVYGNQLPTYRLAYDYTPADSNQWTITCRISTEGVDDDFKMFVPLEITFENNRKAYLRLLVDKPEMSFTLPVVEHKPRKLKLNPFESVLAEIKD